MAQARTAYEQTGAVKCARGERGRLLPIDALARFIEKCRFEPETGCVVWTGGITMGRGHHDPYPSFWFEGKRWPGHRWAAQHIHGLVIDGFQVDHWCPNIPRPNTLCVEHVQPLTSERNRHLQAERRRQFIHLQVGLLTYEDVYGPVAEVIDDRMPFYAAPAWLTGETNDTARCPF